MDTPAALDTGVAEFIKLTISEALAGINQRMWELEQKGKAHKEEKKTPYDSGESSGSDPDSSSSRSPRKKHGSQSKSHDYWHWQSPNRNKSHAETKKPDLQAVHNLQEAMDVTTWATNAFMQRHMSCEHRQASYEQHQESRGSGHVSR